MNCADVREKLLDVLDGTLPPGEGAVIEEHLTVCDRCRAEMGALKAGSDALKASLPALAPAGPHLTGWRLGRLMEAYARERKVLPLAGLRALVAAAAVAAILVSGLYVAQSLRNILRPAVPAPELGQDTAFPAPYPPVVLAALDQKDPVRSVRTFTMEAAGMFSASPRARRGPRYVETTSAGISVPVDHVFYDAEESSHWW